MALQVVATGALGPVHGRVGALDQGVDVFAVMGIDRDADAGRDAEFVAGDMVGLGEYAQQLLAELDRLFGFCQVGHEYDEFVAALARDGIAVAHVVLEALGYFA